MATNYPGAVDSFVNPTATDTLDSATVPHAAQHDNINDAMSAVQVTLGVNPQGSSATVVARLTALDSTVSGKAATNQTMYVGTTALTINRSSASQTLTGVSVDGNSGTVTNGVYTTTTSLPNVTSVNSTTIPASATLLTDASTIAVAKGGTGATATTGTAGSNVLSISPALTGTPTAPTAAVDTNTTQIASTAFVLGQASTTTPVIDGTATIGTATTFARADHKHPTDTTRATAGANSDITSLTGLTTALSVGQGGTGQSTLTSGNALIGAGTSGVATTPVSTSGGADSIVKSGTAGVITAGSGGITSSGQLAVSTSSTSSPQVTVQPTGSFTKSVTSITYGTSIAATVNLSDTKGLWVGQVVTGSGFAATSYNTSMTITSVTANTSIGVSGTGFAVGGASTGTLTASGTGVNVQEWQSSTGTAVSSIDGSGNFTTLGNVKTSGSSTNVTTTPTSVTVASTVNSVAITSGSITMTGTAGSGINAGSNAIQTTGNISGATITATTFSGSGASLTSLNGANITASTVSQSAMVNTKTLSRLVSSVSTGTGTSANTFVNIFPSGSATYTMAADTTYAVRMFLYWSRSAATTSTTLAVKFNTSSTLQSITMGSLSMASASVSSSSIGGYVTSTGTPTLNVNSVAATTTTTQVAVVEGFLRSATGSTSTLNPQFASTVALTGSDVVSIAAGSYIELTNLGTGASVVLPYGSTGWA